MIVAPCSIKTLSGIVNSYDENLMIRAADVTLKEKRRLVLVVRETPLHLGHLRLMTAAAEIGATIFPPVPAFYNRPDDLDDVIDQSVARMLDQVGIVLPGVRRWEGTTDRLHETE
jgi:4-hydroxy-3-polyprenylbenzoate decarboxylase